MSAKDAEEVLQNWEKLKAKEKGGRGILAGVPRSMPALTRAQRIGEKVARVGFDWHDAAGSRAKVAEEIGELDAAIASGDRSKVEEEMGDALFALVNLSRHLHVDAEGALRGTIDKFTRRFAHVEARVKELHGGWGEAGASAGGAGEKHLPLAVLDAYWEEAKREARVLDQHPRSPARAHPRGVGGGAQDSRRRGQGLPRTADFRWVQGRSVLDASKMTDLPASLREKLAPLEIERTIEVADERRAADDTRKLLVRLRDGATSRRCSSPGSPARGTFSLARSRSRRWRRATKTRTTTRRAKRPGTPPVRVTQCISTQVGCAQGCVFCASGVAGLKRNLGADEIVAQVLTGRARLDDGERLSNVVYMGMGEPLANYDATARSLRLLTHPDGIALSSRAHDRLHQRPGPRDHSPGSGIRWQDGSRRLAARGRRRDALAPHAHQQEVPARRAHGRPARVPAAATAAHHHRVHARRRQE